MPFTTIHYDTVTEFKMKLFQSIINTLLSRVEVIIEK